MAAFDDAFGKIADGAQAKAVTNTFDEGKGVAGRVQSITDTGGALMTAARTRAKQAMQKRGTQNTSLAGQAGEQAVIEAAMPIASTDAQLYQQQKLANQTAENQVGISNAQTKAQVGIAGQQLGENSRQFDASLGWDKEKTGNNLLEQKRQFDGTMSMEGRKLDQQGAQFNSQIGLETLRTNLQNEQFNKNLSQQDKQFADKLMLENKQLTAQREQFAQKFGLDSAQLQLNRDQLGQQDRQFLAELDAKQKQLAQQESQFTRDQSNKVALANLDSNNREKLMAIEAQYKGDIAGNENISRAWGSMMDSVSSIQNNPDIGPEAKATMIQNAQAGFQSFTNFWKKVSGNSVDVSDLLRFGPSGSVPVTAPSAPIPPPYVNQGSGSGGQRWDFDEKRWRDDYTDTYGTGAPA